MNLDVEPQASKDITIDVKNLKAKKNVEYFVNFAVTNKVAAPLIPAGTNLANDQFRLPVDPIKDSFVTGHPMKVSENGDHIMLTGNNLTFVFNRKSGMVTSYKVGRTEYLQDGFGLQPNFWRAPTDNDYGNGEPKRTHVWKEASKHFDVVSVELNDNALKILYKLPAGNTYTCLLYTSDAADEL